MRMVCIVSVGRGCSRSRSNWPAHCRFRCRSSTSFTVRRIAIMNPVTLPASLAFVLAGLAIGALINLFLAAPFLVVALLVGMSVRVANVWEKFVVLRIGKLQSIRGAGFFRDCSPSRQYRRDHRRTHPDHGLQCRAGAHERHGAGQRRRDHPRHVHNAQKAALAMTDYRQAIDRVAQTPLRELIGATMLAALLSVRPAADQRCAFRVPLGRTRPLWCRVRHGGCDYKAHVLTGCHPSPRYVLPAG